MKTINYQTKKNGSADFRNSRLGNMKKFMMLFCFVLSCCTMANAHAGLADRYLEMKISVDALVLVIAVTQVFAYFFLRYSKSKVSCWYKKLIIRITKRVYRKSYLKWCASWALSSLVFTPYVIGLSMAFFFLAFIPLVVFLIYYSSWVLNMEKRKKHLTGIRGLSLLLSVSFQQALGYLIYALICETSTFHRFVYYTDEEYEMFDIKLYPGIEGFDYITGGFAVISIITAIPFIVLFIMRTWRYFCMKFDDFFGSR